MSQMTMAVFFESHSTTFSSDPFLVCSVNGSACREARPSKSVTTQRDVKWNAAFIFSDNEQITAELKPISTLDCASAPRRGFSKVYKIKQMRSARTSAPIQNAVR